MQILIFPEKFIVMSIIEKIFKSWEDFGLDLKHKKEKLSLDDLMIDITIEEEHKNKKHVMSVESSAKMNLTVGNKSNKEQKGKFKFKTKSKAKIQKKAKEHTLLELWSGWVLGEEVSFKESQDT